MTDQKDDYEPHDTQKTTADLLRGLCERQQEEIKKLRVANDTQADALLQTTAHFMRQSAERRRILQDILAKLELMKAENQTTCHQRDACETALRRLVAAVRQDEKYVQSEESQKVLYKVTREAEELLTVIDQLKQ